MNSRLLLTLLAGAALALPAAAQPRTDRTVRMCQDNVRQRAMDQFGTDRIQFDQINNNRNGWVNGTVRIGYGDRAQDHRFSCSVNMDNGYVRSARIENEPVAYNDRDRDRDRGRYGEAGREMGAAGMDGCRAAVADRIRDQGFRDVRINSMNQDPDGDFIRGWARAEAPEAHPESFSFSCRLDRNTGLVQSTDVTRR